MRRLSIASFAFTLLLPTLVSAATFRSGEAVSLPAPVSDDLYVVSGGTADIDKDVNGDLFIVGQRIDITGRVAQGINVAGGEVRILSMVGNDVRVAGGTVEVRGTIRGDLIVFGGNVVVGNDGTVMGDVVANGGNVLLRGPVGRNLLVRGGSVALEGIFHGNVDARGGAVTVAGPVEGNAKLVAEKLQVLPSASFKGAVDYWAKDTPVDFGASLAEGQPATFHPEYAYEPREARPGKLAGILGALTIVSLLSGALILLLLLLATRTFFVDAAKVLRRRPWWSFLWGALFFIVSPIVMLLLAVTVIGIPLALLLLSSYLITLLFAAPVTAVAAARWMELTLQKKWNFWALFGVAFAALVVLKLLSLVPFIGWAVKVVVVFFAIGAVIITKAVKWKKVR